MPHGGTYDEDVLRVLDESGVRALLIGRRALVVLGAPVMTSAYDLWIHIDDIEKLNEAFEHIEHYANHDPAVARKRGRYVLENDQHIDVMVARAQSGPDGRTLSFDEAWAARSRLPVHPGLEVAVPCIEQLIATKRWGSRPRDLVDIEWLEVLRQERP